jgi:hypothetical protein
MKYDEHIIPVCEECGKASEPATKHCEKCGIEYCQHFASNIDLRYCANCMDDFKVVNSVEIKVTEYHNPENGEVTSRRRQLCKKLHLQGTDYLFAAAQIGKLSDEELDATIEYHKAIASIMLNEREVRKVENNQKLQKIKLNLTRRADVDSTGAIKTPKTREKKEKTIQAPTREQIIAALTVMLGGKKPDDKLVDQMMKAGQK